MKDHEIVLKRDKKLAEMEKSINKLGPINTDCLRRENLSLSIFHELSYYRKNKRGGALCHRANQ